MEKKESFGFPSDENQFVKTAQINDRALSLLSNNQEDLKRVIREKSEDITVSESKRAYYQRMLRILAMPDLSEIE